MKIYNWAIRTMNGFYGDLVAEQWLLVSVIRYQFSGHFLEYFWKQIQ